MSVMSPYLTCWLYAWVSGATVTETVLGTVLVLFLTLIRSSVFISPSPHICQQKALAKPTSDVPDKPDQFILIFGGGGGTGCLAVL